MDINIQPGNIVSTKKPKKECKHDHFTMGDTGYDPKCARLMNRDKKKSGKKK